MRIVLTPEEIADYQVEFAGYPAALKGLMVIEDCEGDLEDAAITLAIQSGQQPDTGDRWLEGLAKRWRSVICQENCQPQLADQVTGKLIETLTASTEIPAKLVTVMAIYVYKVGVQGFCQPLTEKLSP
jgi:hypothetical protein